MLAEQLSLKHGFYLGKHAQVAIRWGSWWPNERVSVTKGHRPRSVEAVGWRSGNLKF